MKGRPGTRDAGRLRAPARWLAAALALLALASPAAGGAFDRRPAGEPRNFLVWLSLDGLRADYLERADTPVFDRLIREGVSTRRLIPVFPSLTFPSHASQATGVPVRDHGIPLNTFYDRARGRIFRFPPFAGLLQAEPIWTTARRQGLRVAVFDWPLSHRQTGPYAADHFGQAYDGSLGDEDRMENLLATWRTDRGRAPLRLLMGYGDEPDRVGHAVGPEGREIEEMIAAVDARLGRFLEGLRAQFDRIRAPGDQLVLFVTSDHGMSGVHTAVNVDRLTGLDGSRGTRTLTGGPVAMIYLPEDGEDIRQSVLARVAEFPFVSAYPAEQLPEALGLGPSDRVGDLVLILRTGYSFHRGAPDVTAPAAALGGPLGAHGYDPAEDPGMASLAVFWRYPKPYGGRVLDEAHGLQLHATAAAVLGIRPAPGARADPIPLPDLSPGRFLKPLRE